MIDATHTYPPGASSPPAAGVALAGFDNCAGRSADGLVAVTIRLDGEWMEVADAAATLDRTVAWVHDRVNYQYPKPPPLDAAVLRGVALGTRRPRRSSDDEEPRNPTAAVALVRADDVAALAAVPAPTDEGAGRGRGRAGRPYGPAAAWKLIGLLAGLDATEIDAAAAFTGPLKERNRSAVRLVATAADIDVDDPTSIARVAPRLRARSTVIGASVEEPVAAAGRPHTLGRLSVQSWYLRRSTAAEKVEAVDACSYGRCNLLIHLVDDDICPPQLQPYRAVLSAIDAVDLADALTRAVTATEAAALVPLRG